MTDDFDDDLIDKDVQPSDITVADPTVPEDVKTGDLSPDGPDELNQ